MPPLAFGERSIGKRGSHSTGCRLWLPGAVHQAERPVFDGMAAAPPFVGPRECNRATSAFFECRADLHGRERGLSRFAFANAVRSGFGEQQRLLPGNVLESGQIRLQLRFPMQVHVERAHIEEREVQKFRGRVVDVREEAVG